MNWVFIIGISLPPILVLFHALYRTLPDYNEIKFISGVYDDISITRSAKGIPEISAENLEDFFFAFGYIHAQDRLWQMDLLRRTSQGTLSEILGEPALEKDIFARNLRFYNKSEELFSLSSKAQLYLKRYSEGINSYADTNYLPIEYFFTWSKFKRWSPLDTLTIWRYMSFIICVNWQQDVMRSELYEIFGDQGFMVMDEGKVFDEYFTVQGNELPKDIYKVHKMFWRNDMSTGGKSEDIGFVESSNAWVISGDFTASGKPLLANDPHLTNTVPSLLYLVKAQWGNGKVLGGSIPGLPGFLFGSNHKVSWGVTSLLSDTVDLYSHTISGTKYLYNGKWEELGSFKEDIYIKNSDTKRLTFYTTNSGPILYGKEGNISLRWAANEILDTSLDGFIGLFEVENVRSLRVSLEKIVMPQLNVVFASKEGDIGYQAVGKHPLRDYNGLGVLKGSDPNNRWKEYIKYEELPYTINPEKGYIVTANNRPVTHMYKHFNSFGGEHFDGRAKRISVLIDSLIDSKQKITIKHIKDIMYDEFSNLAKILTPIWLNLIQDQDANSAFKKWDFKMSKNSYPAAIFSIWFQNFTSEFLKDKIRSNLSRNLPNSFVYRNYLAQGFYKENCAFCPYVSESKCISLLKNSFYYALSTAKGRSWGEIHKNVFKNIPLSYVTWFYGYFDIEYPSGGSDTTVNAKLFAWNGDFNSIFSPQGRFIFDFGNVQESLWGISTGQSGNGLSSHYRDFVFDFEEGYLEDIYSKQKTEGKLLSTKK
ncbi:hypothetical protein SteCoe_37867 [Stentor coeruleus]|uniref:Penicillin amidase n=1 Tax=Stentor coeruleus TaxID=5963 RepID=A0A1R2AM81_9CILI|nr:hypothetical protein SteCoe_37867 [Stentor coeruleus]